jgi:hypothetical protein
MAKRHTPLTRNDYVSNTDPSDPDAIPAFESSAGLAKDPHDRRSKPVMVDKHALANFAANADPVAQRELIAAANVAALYSKKAIRPDEIAAVRRRALEIVVEGLQSAEEVMRGTKVWSNVQVRVFGLLLERTIPKMSTITIESAAVKTMEEMTMDELEALALGKKNHEAVDAVVKQAGELDVAANRTESVSAAKKLKHALAEIASIDAAEKSYKADLNKAPAGRVPTLKKATKTPHKPA